MSIGVVIVTFESQEVIGKCLDACLKFPDLDIIVVDNASKDGTVGEVRQYRNVRLIANEDNRGFAGAVNQGIAQCNSEFVLLLNPDTELLTSPTLLAEYCEGAAGGCLLAHDSDRPQDGFLVRAFPTPATLAFEVLGLNRLFAWNPVNRRYRVRLSHQSVVEVDQPAGAFLMVRKEAWAAVSGMDESFYPVWFEDVDFCLRLKAAGYSIRYVPYARARHLGGHSASKVSWESRQTYWYGSLLRYAVKHFSPQGRFVVAAAVWAGVMARMVLALVAHRNLSAVSVYSRVMGYAALSVFAGRGVSLGAPHEFTVNP